MSFLELAKKRYSVRSYLDRPVEKEKLLQVLEAARIAPSAVNKQPWNFIVVTNENTKNKIAETYPREWFKTAPAVIVVCGDHSKSWKRKDGKDHCNIDVAIAIDHMTLAATDLGLGTCWVCAFDAKQCHKILGLPENLEVIALIPIGYPADTAPENKNRMDISEIVSWEKYR
ncbi:MAG: nitroreductase [Epulopiscium sp.]|jgi:nitroreductase|nr:nitroreductase [Candidatus Epulonipiscium sp.]